MNNTKQNHIAIEAQRTRLLAHLHTVGDDGCTTIQAREQLDIIAPAPRVFELRHDYGHNIQTVRSIAINAQGNSHRVARYVLMQGVWRK